LTWSVPIQVNKTPPNISSAKQQAFTPSVTVAANGDVAVTYYDLRNPDKQSGGLPTDYWIVFGRPNQDLTNANNWKSEQRLTNSSFNMELAPIARGYFVGDYAALSAGGENQNSFSAMFAETVSSSDPSSIFFRDPSLDDSNQPVSPALDQRLASSGDLEALATPIVDAVKSQQTDALGQSLRTAPWASLQTSLEIARLDQIFAADVLPTELEVQTQIATTARLQTQGRHRNTPRPPGSLSATSLPPLSPDWYLPPLVPIE
jgi:hypothetical protein